MDLKNGVSSFFPSSAGGSQSAVKNELTPFSTAGGSQSAVKNELTPFSLLKKKYGISLEEYAQFYDSVSGRCDICRRQLRPLHLKDAPQVGLRPNVDHDHETERIRGLLCHECNPGIGQFQHDPKLLLQAIHYLERHGQVCKQKSNC